MFEIGKGLGKRNVRGNLKTENFKRPSHMDFMTSEELKKAEFSGLRANSVTEDLEIWVFGELRKRISRFAWENNPNAIADAMQEIFGS